MYSGANKQLQPSFFNETSSLNVEFIPCCQVCERGGVQVLKCTAMISGVNKHNRSPHFTCPCPRFVQELVHLHICRYVPVVCYTYERMQYDIEQYVATSSSYQPAEFVVVTPRVNLFGDGVVSFLIPHGYLLAIEKAAAVLV